MQNKLPTHFLFRWLLALLFVPLAWGYEIARYNSQPITWGPGTVTMQIQLGSSTALSDGSTYNSSVQAAMLNWNSQLGTVQFSNQVGAVAAPVDHNGANEIGFDSTVYGTAFDANVLAVTIYYYTTTPRADGTYPRTQADIIFNSAYAWDSYRGALRSAEEIQRVALHELGHVLGLKHPDLASPPQYVTALMNSQVSNLDTLASDDIAGAQFLYGAPNAVPSITSNPFNLTVYAGQNAQFVAGARGSPAPTCQWQRLPAGSGSWADISDAGAYSGTGTTTLSISSATTAMNGDQFRCVATNASGSATSNPATLTTIVATPPSIASNTPFYQSVTAGNNANFYLSLSGSTPMTFRWQRLPVGGAIWSDLSDVGSYFGSSAATLYVNDTTIAMSGDQFRCVVANFGGSATSNPATLTVSPAIAPKISGLPATIMYGFGDQIDLSGNVAGSLPITYLWKKDGITLTTAGRYVKYGATPSDSGIYTLTATNIAGTDSFSIDVTVNAAVAPTITSQPVSLSISQGTTASFGVSAVGTNPITYQWYLNGQLIAGATSSTLSIANVQSVHAGNYTAVATNSIGSTTSGVATLSVNPTQGVTSVAAGGYDSLFIRSDGSLWGNGWNLYGELGIGSNYRQPSPALIATNVILATSSIFRGHSLFIRSDGTLWGMGDNSWGQLGDGTSISRPNPIQISTDVVAAAAGSIYSFFIKSDGTLWGMGGNSNGELGDGTTVNRSNPVQISTDVIAVAVGNEHSLFVKADGTLWTMGYNVWGSLGDGTRTGRANPVQITSGVIAVAAAQHSLFLKADSSLWAMGYNEHGELGDGTMTMRTSPVLITTGVASISCGWQHSLFVKVDGTLWGMGSSDGGQIAGTVNSYSSPVQIASGVRAAVAGRAHSLFIRSDATLWAMGFNDLGQLGDGTTSIRVSPVLIAQGALTAPNAPSGLIANKDSLAPQIRVTWSPTIGATTYEVWRSTTNAPGSANRIANNVPIALYYDLTGLPNTIYYYWIKAVNSAGASNFSTSGTNMISPSNAVITFTVQ